MASCDHPLPPSLFFNCKNSNRNRQDVQSHPLSLSELRRGAMESYSLPPWPCPPVPVEPSFLPTPVLLPSPSSFILRGPRSLSSCHRRVAEARCGAAVKAADAMGLAPAARLYPWLGESASSCGASPSPCKEFSRAGLQLADSALHLQRTQAE